MESERKEVIERYIQDWYWDDKSHKFAYDLGEYYSNLWISLKIVGYQKGRKINIEETVGVQEYLFVNMNFTMNLHQKFYRVLHIRVQNSGENSAIQNTRFNPIIRLVKNQKNMHQTKKFYPTKKSKL